MVDACDSTPPASTITPDAGVKSGVHEDRAALHPSKVAGVTHHDDLGLDVATAHRVSAQLTLVRGSAADARGATQPGELGLAHQERHLQGAMPRNFRTASARQLAERLWFAVIVDDRHGLTPGHSDVTTCPRAQRCHDLTPQSVEALRVIGPLHRAAVLAHDNGRIGEREHERNRPPEERNHEAAFGGCAAIRSQ